MTHAFVALYQRELASYFLTPLAFVFLAIFALAANGLAWQFGGFFQAGLADLSGFFAFHPWLYVVFMPALAMRLWAEERHTGMDEVLLTLPVSVRALVLAKFCAAWTVAMIGLALTTPLWLAVNYLGEPDNAAIFSGYVASALLAGLYLGIGFCLSAITENQVIAFVLGVFAAFALTVPGAAFLGRAMADVLPRGMLDAITWASPLARFQVMQRGLIEFTDLFYFASFIVMLLAFTALLIAAQRAEGAR